MNDIKVIIIDREGASHTLMAPTDMNMNIMEVCMAYELPVLGECGGMAMCASCQCYVQSSHELNEKLSEEDAMLSEAFNVKPTSRLSCQIQVSLNLEGLKVELAPED